MLGAEQDDADRGTERQECLPGRGAIQHDATRDRPCNCQEERQPGPIRIGHDQVQVPTNDSVTGAIEDAAYLVARGVRPLAIVGEGITDRLGMVRAMTVLGQYSDDRAIRFVVDHKDGTASWGYAAAAWVVDLYRWVRLEEKDESRRHQVLGLLLGYGPEAIARHLDSLVGRLPTQSP